MPSSAIRWTLQQTADTSIEWELVSFSAREALNEPYELVCDVATDASDDPAALVGKDVKVTAERDDLHRSWCGIVRRVEKGMAAVDHTSERPTFARLYVVPALEALAHSQDTRLFQDKTAVDILQAVLGEALGAYGRQLDVRVTGTYPKREYCVQYLESNLHFVSRLMEEEGIGYWFTHDGDQEVLVLSDANAAFEPLAHAGSGALPYVPRGSGVGADPDPVHELVAQRALVTTKTTVRDYDWTHPAMSVESSSGAADEQSRTRERYRYGRVIIGEHADGSGYGANDPARQAQLSQQARAVLERTFAGRGAALAMRPGTTFSLQGHPQYPELDADYVITHVTQRRARPVGEGSHEGYENEFRCIPKATVWRPQRARRKPAVRSTHIAKVVGPAGEEIHTDEHGRIRVQFDWDRQGTNDDHSTCWLRVMQPWAGTGWGHVWIPRIGMEVVVELVNGDIDRPLVLSSIYDGTNRTPYGLPSEKTKSTIKSSSSLGGAGSNELRFEDKKGSEEVFLHAQKDFNELVENNHDTTVGNNQTNTVGVDQTETVGSNQTLTVGADRTIHVKGSFTETIDAGETRTVSAGVTETISGGETRDVSGGITETINGGETRSVVGGLKETITAAHTRTTTGSFTELISGALTQNIAGGANITTPASYTIMATGGVNMTAAGGWTLITGGGNTVVAPAGHNSIDFEYESEGGSKAELYAVKEGSYIFNAGVEVIRIAVGGAKLDFGVMKITVSAYYMEEKPKQFAQTAIRLAVVGASIIKANVFSND